MRGFSAILPAVEIAARHRWRHLFLAHSAAPRWRDFAPPNHPTNHCRYRYRISDSHGRGRSTSPMGIRAPALSRSQTWARKGSMEQSVHRPLSQSGLPIVRRVNSAIGERVVLDLRERRPRRPVVTDNYIDPTTRTGRTSFALRLRLRRRSRAAARPSAHARTRAPSAYFRAQAC